MEKSRELGDRKKGRFNEGSIISIPPLGYEATELRAERWGLLGERLGNKLWGSGPENIFRWRLERCLAAGGDCGLLVHEDLAADGSDSRRPRGKELLPLELRVQLMDPALKTDCLPHLGHGCCSPECHQTPALPQRAFCSVKLGSK